MAINNDESGECDCGGDCNREYAATTAPTDPPPGSWAETARFMASFYPDDGFDWDAWKDEQKELDWEEMGLAR